jgi:hypothetical protein
MLNKTNNNNKKITNLTDKNQLGFLRRGPTVYIRDIVLNPK